MLYCRRTRLPITHPTHARTNSTTIQFTLQLTNHFTRSHTHTHTLVLEVRKGQFYLGGERKLHIGNDVITTDILNETRAEIMKKVPVTGHDLYTLENAQSQMNDFDIILQVSDISS